MEATIVINEDGSLEFIYTDALASLLTLGKHEITRASHVEPFTGGGWYADMGPSGGPVLFANGEMAQEHDGQSGPAPVGFKTRQEALDAEVAWLQKNRGL